MTHGKCCLLSPLTYTEGWLGQLRNASFCTELFSWKLIFWSCPQYPSLFFCWLAPKIAANFNERETFRGEYRHSMEERIMSASPDGAKAWIQLLGYSVNFFLADYCNLAQECSALVLIWPWKPWQSVNIPLTDGLVLFLLKTRKLILKVAIEWEIKIMNIFHRLIVRLELAQMHRSWPWAAGGSWPNSLSSLLLQVFDSWANPVNWLQELIYNLWGWFEMTKQYC